MMHKWQYIEAFKRHIEEMESFRRAHSHLTPDQQPEHTRKTPEPPTGSTPGPTEFNIIDDNGNNIVVPIWDAEVPKGSQN